MAGGEEQAEVIVAAVALVISVVALLATFMQVLQQYYASAHGYSQCSEKVIGEWAKYKSRSFSWEELRFEVTFEAPVIFASPPTNKRGPIPGQNIVFLDGTQKSLDETMMSSEMDLSQKSLLRSPNEKVHTAFNERATWFLLLYAIQGMELKSKEWQKQQYGPRGSMHDRHDLPREPPSLEDNHTFTIALQRKKTSWDTMPKSISKPYATTTMCHLIEILAALGIYWKEFDRRRDRYWAEGNGFLVLGERASDLGIIFSFQVYGQCEFESNRVIPNDYMKELCFGYVPTIYRSTSDKRRLAVPTDMAEDLGSLQMGSRREIAESLTAIGCNNITVNYFLEDDTRTSHLFPVSFEILGMLGRNMHLDNSSFTFVPNPTPDRWDKRSISLIKMLQSFGQLFGAGLSGSKRNRVIVRRIMHHIEQIQAHHGSENGVKRVILLQLLHKAIDDADTILTSRRKMSGGKTNTTTTAQENEAYETLDPKRREIVQDVMRSHLQEVLRLLNERDDKLSDSKSLHVPTSRPSSPNLHSGVGMDVTTRGHVLRFEDIDEASPDERQHRLMEMYFSVIRRRVVPFAMFSTGRRASLMGGRPASLHSFREAKANVHLTEPSGDRPGSSRSELVTSVTRDDADTGTDDDGTVPDKDREPGSTTAPLAAQPVSHDDVWCTLVFRMICWLMLHDFNKLDIQLNKSELLGSRMPVYIS